VATANLNHLCLRHNRMRTVKKVNIYNRFSYIKVIFLCINSEANTNEAWFRQQPKEFYAADFQGLVKRWGKCLNIQGHYVEK
jgi:hypothetical protein